MRGLFLFVAGIVVGLAVQTAVAQNQNRGIVGLNHVALSVPNLDEALAYYTKTMGFPEAFRNLDQNGQLQLAATDHFDLLGAVGVFQANRHVAD